MQEETIVQKWCFCFGYIHTHILLTIVFFHWRKTQNVDLSAYFYFVVKPILLLNTSSCVCVQVCVSNKKRICMRAWEREAQVSSRESGVEFAISVAIETETSSEALTMSLFKGLLAQTKAPAGSSYHMPPTELNTAGTHKSMHTWFFNHRGSDFDFSIKMFLWIHFELYHKISCIFPFQHLNLTRPDAAHLTCDVWKPRAHYGCTVPSNGAPA